MRIIFWIPFVIFCILYLLRFKIISETKLKPNKNYLIAGSISSINTISDGYQTMELGDFRIKTTRLPEYNIGDRIKIVGKLEEKVINKLYSEFWFIYPEISFIYSDNTGKDGGGGLLLKLSRKIDDLRKNFENNFSRILPSPQANLLSGIVLGSKAGFSPEFHKALRVSGTLHIVVASGMNIVILSKIIFDSLIGRFKRRVVIFVTLFVILIYTFLAGFEAPIIRASIMAFLAFSAQSLGRSYGSSLGLFLAAGAMLLVNPTLIFEVSFQLSFAATAGLIFLSPKVGEWVEFQQGPSLHSARMDPAIFLILRKPLEFFKPDLVETLAAQIAVLPILLASFGQFNLLSILPNILIGFLVPILMRGGFLFILISSISLFLARILGFVLWVPLTYMVGVINLFGKIDWLVLKVSLPWWFAGFYWAGLCWVFCPFCHCGAKPKSTC